MPFLYTGVHYQLLKHVHSDITGIILLSEKTAIGLSLLLLPYTIVQFWIRLQIR